MISQKNYSNYGLKGKDSVIKYDVEEYGYTNIKTRTWVLDVEEEFYVLIQYTADEEIYLTYLSDVEKMVDSFWLYGASKPN